MATKARKRIDMSKARVKIVAKENPRNKGTRAYKVFEALKKHAKLPVKTIFEKTDYQRRDLDWDVEHGYVKLVKKA